jgi:hypothetical protein
VGWWAEPINPDSVDYLAKLEDPELQRANDEMGQGWSSHPTSHVRELLWPNTEPTWSERLGCYVARLRDVNFAVRLQPADPFYG